MKGRYTVVEVVSHQSESGQPTMISDSRYSRQLLTDEQPFIRKGKANEEWQPLTQGWLPQTSLLCLRNDAGKFSRVPTKEEREELAGMILEVTFTTPVSHLKRDMHDPPAQDPVPAMIILPGESCRFVPFDLGAVRVRSKNGETPYTLSMTPL